MWEPGQCARHEHARPVGDPYSPHYRDLAAGSGKGDYFPLLYSRHMIEAATGQIIRWRRAP